jgi:ankyrin repeat protein
MFDKHPLQGFCIALFHGCDNVRYFNHDKVRFMDNGAEVNEHNKYGETAIMNAARWGHKESVVFLIAEGADINAKTKSGETVLEFAEYSYHKDVVELLKTHGAEE